MNKFINLVSNSSVRTSDGLDSCTETIELSEPFTLDGHRIRLIDTPGFDDSSKSDVDILEVIATFLSTQYVPLARSARLPSDPFGDLDY